MIRGVDIWYYVIVAVVLVLVVGSLAWLVGYI